MIPLTTLWGTYINLAGGESMNEISVRYALGGFISSLFVFSFVGLFISMSLIEPDNKKDKK